MANSALFSEGSSYFEESAGLYTVNEGLTHNKCYARTTEFGGLFGKGQATVSVAITTGAASASYRLVDEDGTIAIDWGAYGVPESFLIYKNEIIKKYIGPLNQQLIDEINLLIK